LDLELKNKVVIATAASKGLGKAAAKTFAQEGAHVVISARSEALETTAEEIRAETGTRVLAVRGDVTRQGDVEALVEATLSEFGAIDILFINAGGPPPGTFLSLTPEDWEAACTLTLMSAVRLCYAVVPHMVERGGGSIVTTQSVSVKQPIDNLILSNSLRMAVIGMIKSLANELGPHGIRVNSINPGYTWTGRVEQLITDRSNRSGESIEEESSKITASSRSLVKPRSGWLHRQHPISMGMHWCLTVAW